jgi:hypothetical protein
MLDTILSALLITLGLLPLVVAVARKTSSRVTTLIVLFWVFLAGIGLWQSLRPEQAAEQLVVNARPVEVLVDGYVSSDTCQKCHPQQYESWHHSYHRTMTQVATPQSVVGNFDDVRLESHGQIFHLKRRGDQFWVQKSAASSEKSQREPSRQIALVTGSHHMQVYWYPTGKSRVLGQLPFVYLIPQQKWIPRQAAFLRPPPESLTQETGRWNTECIKCHTTHGRPRFETRQKMDTQVAEFGIACEACHGEAQDHVLANRNPRRRYELHTSQRSDPTIVHPERLDHRRSSQMCGQCHSVTLQHSFADAMDWLQNGSEYRPGDDLEQFKQILRGVGNKPSRILAEHQRRDPHLLEDRFWSDGMVRVSGREYNGLEASPCFQRGQLSCLSCHSMHQSADDPRTSAQWADDQLKYSAIKNDACVQCHREFEDSEQLAAHTHHPANSSGAVCYNCHMPHTTYGLLKAIRSHQIDSPTVQASLQTGRPNACNQCHLDKTLEWTAGRLEEWYGTPKPEMSEDERTIAASVLWMLNGDAGQRALATWSMGWRDAQQASGRRWIAPLLAQQLNDPYDAIRLIAHRSLQTLRGFEEFPFEFMASREIRAQAVERAVDIWSREAKATPHLAGDAVLIRRGGRYRKLVVRRLLEEQNSRRVNLKE